MCISAVAFYMDWLQDAPSFRQILMHIGTVVPLYAIGVPTYRYLNLLQDIFHPRCIVMVRIKVTVTVNRVRVSVKHRIRISVWVGVKEG